MKLPANRKRANEESAFLEIVEYIPHPHRPRLNGASSHTSRALRAGSATELRPPSSVLQLHSQYTRRGLSGVPSIPAEGGAVDALTACTQFSPSLDALETHSPGEVTGIRLPVTPHAFSPPRIPPDRVAPEGRDPRAATPPRRSTAQSRMTIAPPPPTQPSRAARSSSGRSGGGGSEQPIAARSSYAASVPGHVIGGRRSRVPFSLAVRPRRTRHSLLLSSGSRSVSLPLCHPRFRSSLSCRRPHNLFFPSPISLATTRARSAS